MASVLHVIFLIGLSFAFWTTGDCCPGGWTQYGSRCFYFCNYQADWANAERYCTALGANLASFHSYYEYIFLKDLVRTKKGSWERTWIGGHDAVRESVWMWSDGSTFNYWRWGSGEPNGGGRENCMEINLKGSQQYINDEGCSRNNYFICAKKA
ncbi:ladderlectin-like [Poeciliopsis prolifica]|uniref:ladderlectin-like n=1 Tax=Poeciliopsis prolifica TaxID=188132 RepID=UPI00241426FB|nr:ladderlectin-like [Poeciliopsis prolifica]